MIHLPEARQVLLKLTSDEDADVRGTDAPQVDGVGGVGDLDGVELPRAAGLQDAGEGLGERRARDHPGPDGPARGQRAPDPGVLNPAGEESTGPGHPTHDDGGDLPTVVVDVDPAAWRRDLR